MTEEGKVIVSQNAVKHGVFARDLIITSGDGKENAEEYRQLFQNLIESLNPQGQMEHLLVEKIAVDFWRLRRVLRFETGSIRKYLDMVIYDYYNKTDYQGNKLHKTDSEFDEEIKQQQVCVDWNDRYIQALKKGLVSFDRPVWVGEEVKSEIDENLYMVAEGTKLGLLSEEEFFKYEEGNLGWEEILAIFRKAGNTDQDIADAIVVELEKQNEGYRREIYDIEQKKLKNKMSEEVNVKICSLPGGENSEKVMRYERSIQKSIFQNLLILKKLQT